MASRSVAEPAALVVTRVRGAGPDHQVVTVEGGKSGYRKKPCPSCPWRVDAVGEFPAEAFRHSAETAYDMSLHVFSCHTSGVAKPATCAGFLLRGADNNLNVRMGRMTGRYNDDVTDGGVALHDNYRAMAVANGVPKSDPALTACCD